MPPPKKMTIESAPKPEPLVIIPDSVADIAPPAVVAAPTSAPEMVAVAALEPEALQAVATKAEAIVKADLSVVANNIEKTQTEMKTNMDKAMKTAEEFVTFGQGNIEAVMKSSQIWMTGLQDMSKAFAATAQAQMEETVSTMKTLAGLRSIKDAIDLQTSFARTSFEKALSETGKITEHSLKLAEQTLAPITARVTFAVEKFGKAA
jgi:phasin family protein